MAINPLIARGYQGGVVNAFFDGQNQRLERERYQQQTQAAAQQRDMLAKYAEMEQYAAAPPELKAQYVESQKRLHPEFASSPLASLAPEEAFEAMRRGLAAKVGKPYDGSMYQQQRMAGLEDIPISRQKIDMAPLQRQENWAYEQARAQRNADRTYRLDAAQEARLSRPQAGGEDEFARYQAMTPQQRALYNEFKGRPNTLPGPGEVAPTASVSGFGTLPTGTKLTEVQGKNYLGASIMAENIPVLTAALRDGYVPTRQDLFAVGPPLKGALNTVAQELTPREKANPKANDYFNAGSKILTAILRPESGGAITEDEWTMYGPMYLPWPGDSETTRTRKMVSLNAYMKRLAQVSGPASGYFTGAEQVQDEQIIDLPPRAR